VTGWVVTKHLLVALAVFYGVQRLFASVEDKLTGDTKLEIGLWLLDIDTTKRAQNWPVTFAALFDRVFGSKHLSWRCFIRSALLSAALFLISWLWIFWPTSHDLSVSANVMFAAYMSAFGIAASIIPDYVSLLETRFVIHLMSLTNRAWLWTMLLMVDFVLTTIIAAVAVFYVVTFAYSLGLRRGDLHTAIDLWRTTDASLWIVFADKSLSPFFYIAYATSVWAWLYAAAGFLVKLASRFDVTLRWVTHKFDIEHKPLQTIGLMAGLLCAVVYAAAVALAAIPKPEWLRLDWLIIRWPTDPPVGSL
jgi:hypothetical protein